MLRIADILLMVSALAAFDSAAHGQILRDFRVDLAQHDLRPHGAAEVARDPSQPVWLNDLNRLDDSIDDVNALRTSLRNLPMGLRIPLGFSDVYEVPGRPGWRMRANGGLYAVFRESIYLMGDPLIPNGAVFHIGPPVFHDEVFVAPDPSAAFVSGRELPAPDKGPAESGEGAHEPTVRQRPLGSPDVMQHIRNVQPNPTAPSIVRDRTYRSQRIRALLRRAAQG